MEDDFAGDSLIVEEEEQNNLDLATQGEHQPPLQAPDGSSLGKAREEDTVTTAASSDHGSDPLIADLDPTQTNNLDRRNKPTSTGLATALTRPYTKTPEHSAVPSVKYPVIVDEDQDRSLQSERQTERHGLRTDSTRNSTSFSWSLILMTDRPCSSPRRSSTPCILSKSKCTFTTDSDCCNRCMGASRECVKPDSFEKPPAFAYKKAWESRQ
jgi:hypothetical protein